MAKFSLRANGNIEVIETGKENLPFMVGILNKVERLTGEHVELYLED